MLTIAWTAIGREKREIPDGMQPRSRMTAEQDEISPDFAIRISPRRSHTHGKSFVRGSTGRGCAGSLMTVKLSSSKAFP